MKALDWTRPETFTGCTYYKTTTADDETGHLDVSLSVFALRSGPQNLSVRIDLTPRTGGSKSLSGEVEDLDRVSELHRRLERALASAGWNQRGAAWLAKEIGREVRRDRDTIARAISEAKEYLVSF